MTPTNVSIPELPKLALAEGVRGGVAEKGPLDKEYTGQCTLYVHFPQSAVYLYMYLYCYKHLKLARLLICM